MAKATYWTFTDAQTRRLGERKGLDTPVVLAVNGARGAKGIRYPCSPSSKRCSLGVGGFDPFCAGANALSEPPGKYGRKTKTQRN